MFMFYVDGELLEDFEDVVEYVGAVRSQDDVVGECPSCGMDNCGYDTFLLRDGSRICQEEDCLLAYYDVEYVEVDDDEWEDDLEEEDVFDYYEEQLIEKAERMEQ